MVDYNLFAYKVVDEDPEGMFNDLLLMSVYRESTQKEKIALRNAWIKDNKLAFERHKRMLYENYSHACFLIQERKQVSGNKALEKILTDMIEAHKKYAPDFIVDLIKMEEDHIKRCA